MNEIEKIEKSLLELNDWAERKPSTHEFKWYIERIKEYRDALFMYAKFKVGNVVCLNKTPIINEKESWGWIGYKDILIKGAVAIVDSVDFYEGRFRYSLRFKKIGGFTFDENFLDNHNDKEFCTKCGHLME